MLKRIIQICLFLFVISNCYSQYGYINQTKEYIIDKNSSCFIHTNEEQMLIFDCNGRTKYFQFDDNGFCSKFGIDFLKEDAYEIMFDLEKKGYFVDGFIKAPVLVRKKDEGIIDPIQSGIRLINDDFKVIFMSTDVSGHKEGSYAAIWFFKRE